MADYSCEWCKHEEKCKYAYQSTECEPEEMLKMYKVLPEEEYKKVLEFIEYLKTKEKDSDYVENARRQLENNIIGVYPTKKELEYIQDLLAD